MEKENIQLIEPEGMLMGITSKKEWWTSPITNLNLEEEKWQ